MSNDLPWIDVGTTSTPVLLTERCIPSFLKHFTDRSEYRLRWIYHLDQYPLPGLEQFWEENLQQAVRVSKLFDDALLMASRVNQSYGTSCCRVMSYAENPYFHIEDDKEWIKDFSLKDIKERMQRANADAFNFHHKGLTGSTAPNYSNLGVVQKLLENAPKPHWKITETVWNSLALKLGIITIGRTEEETGKQIGRRRWEGDWWVDVGKTALYERGLRTRTHPARIYIDKVTGKPCRGRL